MAEPDGLAVLGAFLEVKSQAFLNLIRRLSVLPVSVGLNPVSIASSQCLREKSWGRGWVRRLQGAMERVCVLLE